MICQACRTMLRPSHLRSIIPSSPRLLSTTRLASTTFSLLPRSAVPSPRTTFPQPNNSRHISSTRPLSQSADSDLSSSMTPAEASIAALISSSISTTSLLVRDVSGGCGSMYAIDIASPEFKGQSILKQQRMVNKALGEKVKEWHGVQIKTTVSEE